MQKSKTKLIVCAGRGRSGSTLMYNMVRLLLIEAFGRDKVYGSTHLKYNKNDNRPYHVVKIHHHDQYLWDKADMVFSTHRDEKGQKLSFWKHQKLMKGKNLNDKELTDFIAYDYSRYLKWASHPNFKETFEFDNLINSKPLIIQLLCNIFNVNVSIEKVIQKLDSLKLPKKGLDIESCLTPHHFTNHINKEDIK